MTEAEVGRIALDLWNSLDFGLGKEAGLGFDFDAYKAARDYALQEVSNPPESRLDPGGRPVDLYAPSVWHAICLLVFLFVKTRIRNTYFNDPEELDRLFGTQLLYRGQARGWNIIPAIWRFPDQLPDNQLRLDALAAYWKNWTSPDHDLSFDLFGRVEDGGAAAAIAQHYGLPTSLVDFTFDPRIAIWFACSESESQPLQALPSGLRDCAVVYFTSFYKLISVSNWQIRLPHPAAARIYRQSGCFVDYGSQPESIPPVLDFEQPWMWLQENCFRLFFPRKYPDDASLREIAHDWIYARDAFFESVSVAKRLSGDSLQPTESAVMMLTMGVKGTPSWRVKDQSPLDLMYTDTEFFDLVRPLESYLRVAALIETRTGTRLDPFILGGIAKTNLDAAKALQEVARFPYQHSPGILWMSERINESRRLLELYLNLRAKPD
jgi:hypothetical protein